MKHFQLKPLINRTCTLLGFFAVAGLSTSTLAQEVNVGHLAPFSDTIAGTEVSVEVNQSTVEALNSVFYGEFSDYLDISALGEPPSFNVDVFAPPNSGEDDPAIEGSFEFELGGRYTVIAIGGANQQELRLISLVDQEPQEFRGISGAQIRIVHAAPFGPPDMTRSGAAVSIRFANGDLVDPSLANVEFGDVSDFLGVPAGTYDLQVRTPDGSTTLIDPLPVDLVDGDVVTLFAVGDGNNQDLGISAFFNDGPSAGTSLSLPLRGTLPETNPIPTLGTIGLLLMIGLLALVAVRRLA